MSDNLKRREVASKYKARITNPEIILPEAIQEDGHIWHVFVIRTKRRDALQEHLKRDGIQTLIHYPIPPHLQKAYRELGYKKGDFPITEEIADTCLSLPIYPGLSDEEINYVCDSIKNFFRHSISILGVERGPIFTMYESIGSLGYLSF